MIKPTATGIVDGYCAESRRSVETTFEKLSTE